MLHSRTLLSGKRKYLLGLTILPFIALICVAFSIRGDDSFDIARREVLLRRIAHELLLQSGDSTSRVLPVAKIAENEYQIRFEHELTFQPGSLVTTTQRLLSKDPLARDYVVNVLNCGNTDVVYGFAISKNVKDDIISCKGRVQPTACYIINIKFKPKGLIIPTGGYLLGGLPLLAFFGFLFLRSGRQHKALPKGQVTGMVALGQMLFDAKNRKLLINGQTIELTGTETRVLHIFASSPNETVERSRLQKEIWEDEGVIVGRSLDMFISKLRKKLEIEPNIKIVVIRNKGYKLEISA